jgi:hypothetical protein
MIPAPQVFAVEQGYAPVSLGNGVAVLAISARTSVSVSVGSIERRSERTPATCGAAMEVP